MENLDLIIGEELTINELVKCINADENCINDDDIRTGEQTNIDNFNGQEGFNVTFEVTERNERGFGVWDFVVKITDIDKL